LLYKVASYSELLKYIFENIELPIIHLKFFY